MKISPTYKTAPHFKNFWQKGNGKELLEWAKIELDFKNFDQYAFLYHEIDELGDSVVKDTYLQLPYSKASALINHYSQNTISEQSEAPESVKKLFTQMQTIPDWYNEDLANIGAKFCMRTGANALIILRDFTLMGGYDYAFLNKPLILTGALKKGAVKRLKDTLEFWVNVTRKDALKVNSYGYQLIVRTRLMHCYARLKIKEKSQNWEYENWGQPINSWDMIATYIGFSLVFMQGLKKLGITLLENEENGVFHLWKYIGYLLGIPSKYLPNNKAEATEQLFLWSSLQDKGDADSAHLAKALLEENLENTIYKFDFQRKLLRSLHISCNQYLLDEEINGRLQIPRVYFPNVFPKLVRNANRLSQKIYSLENEKSYEKLVEIGSKKQLQVLEDYIKHTPKDFQY